MLSWTVSRIRHAGSYRRPIVEADILNGKSVTIMIASLISPVCHCMVIC